MIPRLPNYLQQPRHGFDGCPYGSLCLTHARHPGFDLEPDE